MGTVAVIKCVQSGVYINNRMTFTEVNARLRTDASFSNGEDEDHHVQQYIMHCRIAAHCSSCVCSRLAVCVFSTHWDGLNAEVTFQVCVPYLTKRLNSLHFINPVKKTL